MNIIELKMMVPVWIEVDLDTETVTEVVVADEHGGDLTPMEDREPTVDEVRAIEVANDAEWPEWEVGS